MTRVLPVLLSTLTAALFPLSAAAQVRLEFAGRYSSGIYLGGAAETLAYDPETQRLFVSNATARTVDVLDISEPERPVRLFQIAMPARYGAVNSVAYSRGLLAVAAAADPKTEPGVVILHDVDGRRLNTLTVGANPDAVAFTPDGMKILTADEGEPNDTYTIDPEGTVSIIDLSRPAAELTQEDVRTVDFRSFNGADLDPSVRIFGPGATVAQDLEPEYIAFSADGRTAWVTCQEANAIAVIDVEGGKATRLLGLGFKDHSLPGNALDASDRDGGINLRNWPVFGMHLPDTVAAYEIGGKTYLITANEGDSRDYSGFSEEERVGGVVLDPGAFPNAADLQKSANLGRLKITNTLGDTDGDGKFERLYSFGARSFSIWSEDGGLVYDSGEEFERVTAAERPDGFNSNNETNGSFDSRSDDKGPEPEAVAVGALGGRTYAFVGMERIGGIFVYDVTDPAHPRLQTYINSRDFTGDAAAGTAGDLGPEILHFIPAGDSPTGEPLLAASHEISGTTTLYRVLPPPAARIHAPETTTIAREMRLDASGSTGSGLTYSWSSAEGSVSFYSAAPGNRAVDVQFTDGGRSYRIALTVMDKYGRTGTDNVTIDYQGR